MRNLVLAACVGATAAPLLAHAAKYEIDPLASFVEIQTITDLRWTATEAPEWIDVGWTYSVTATRYELSGSMNLVRLDPAGPGELPLVHFSQVVLSHQAPLSFDFAANARRTFDSSNGEFGRAIHDLDPSPSLWPSDLGAYPGTGSMCACISAIPGGSLLTGEYLSGNVTSTEMALKLVPDAFSAHYTYPVTAIRRLPRLRHLVLDGDPSTPSVYDPVVLPDPDPAPDMPDWATTGRITQVAIVGAVSPVPEPSSIATLLSGLCFLVWRRRRSPSISAS